MHGGLLRAVAPTVLWYAMSADFVPRSNASVKVATDESDASLTERIRSGDQAAFEIIFKRWYAELVYFSLSYTTNNQQVAEDIVHDVLFRVWEQRARWNPTGTIASYLFRATRNRCIDYARHAAVEQKWRRETAESYSHASGALFGLDVAQANEEVELSDLQAAIVRGVARLPQRCQQAFLLHRDHGLTYDEIAAVMQTSPKTVKAQIGRALQSLRHYLAPFLK
jgi:RNA polymerase sigma-70 factor (family 1)